MGLFLQRKQAEPMRFTSRADAFAYMLAWQMEEKGAEPMEAAQRANEFADIMATNMGLPQAVAPMPEGIDKYIAMAEKIGNYCDQHPKAVELLTGAVTFAAGLVAGKKVEQAQEPMQIEKIDFNKID